MMYTNVIGYQIPNLSLPKAKKTNLNRYGRMRLDYLEQNEPNLCDQMMLEGTLLPSCRKMGLDAQQMVDKTLHDLMRKAQMPNRKTNPLGWAQMCNSLKQQAEEMILPMLYEVYRKNPQLRRANHRPPLFLCPNFRQNCCRPC